MNCSSCSAARLLSTLLHLSSYCCVGSYWNILLKHVVDIETCGFYWNIMLNYKLIKYSKSSIISNHLHIELDWYHHITSVLHNKKVLLIKLLHLTKFSWKLFCSFKLYISVFTTKGTAIFGVVQFFPQKLHKRANKKNCYKKYFYYSRLKFELSSLIFKTWTLINFQFSPPSPGTLPASPRPQPLRRVLRATTAGRWVNCCSTETISFCYLPTVRDQLLLFIIPFLMRMFTKIKFFLM